MALQCTECGVQTSKAWQAPGGRILCQTCFIAEIKRLGKAKVRPRGGDPGCRSPRKTSNP